MAFTVTARDQQHNGTTGSQTEVIGPFTPSDDSLVVVAAHGQIANGTASADLPTSPITGGLTWTEEQSYEGTAAPRSLGEPWRNNGGLFHAPVVTGASTTLTIDLNSGTTPDLFYSVCAVDIVGHDVASPIVQSAKNKYDSPDNNWPDDPDLTVTLGSTPATGNLVVVTFGASSDTGGGFAAPTIGGQAMTQVYNRSGGYCQNGLWYRVITGAETNAAITTTSLGNVVGNGSAFAIEVAAAALSTVEQEGFRFRTDSGNEATATWEAAQDTVVTMAAETTKGLRVLLDYTGDPATGVPKLQYRLVGDAASEWEDIT